MGQPGTRVSGLTRETGGLLLLGTLGVWRSLVARFVRDEEVVGSNPATPTS
jgi:hypothetical protein